MQTVYKYQLDVADGEQTIKAPAGFRPLFVAVQGVQLCLWALVYTTEPEISHSICITGTGRPVDAAYSRYIGSVLMPPFVWHVWW